MTDKKYKVTIVDSALKDIPEDEREARANEVLELFEDGPPPDAKPVERLDPGVTACPGCDEDLGAPNRMNLQGLGEMFLYYCDTCDQGYMREAQ